MVSTHKGIGALLREIGGRFECACFGQEQCILFPDVSLHFHDLSLLCSFQYNGIGLVCQWVTIDMRLIKVHELVRDLHGHWKYCESIIGSELWKENCTVKICQCKINIYKKHNMPPVNCNSTHRSYLSHISCGEWNRFSVFDTMCCGFLQVREVCLDPALGLFLANLN